VQNRREITWKIYRWGIAVNMFPEQCRQSLMAPGIAVKSLGKFIAWKSQWICFQKTQAIFNGSRNRREINLSFAEMTLEFKLHDEINLGVQCCCFFKNSNIFQ
jgi:hypothetical protein